MGMPVCTSGSESTPRSFATRSPKARAMANPGYCRPLRKTRRATMPQTVMPLTSPPLARTWASASASTMWSRLRRSAAPCRAKMEAESPTCARAMVPVAVSMTAAVAVLPENSAMGRPWRWRHFTSECATSKIRRSAVARSVSETAAGAVGINLRASCSKMPRTRAATRWPHWPWPSKTAAKSRPAPSSRMRCASWFFQAGF
mmetsp:Transcript_139099/g.444297  ORF Transcript_139099/g.444297 Transcript_139099/m.444297 type:complete len:202 (+) Transcript_139099:473-1078(+)